MTPQLSATPLRLFFVLFAVLFFTTVHGQNFTKQEILSNPTAPEFARMTAVPGVNFYKVKEAFDLYQQQKKGTEKKAHPEQEESDMWEAYYKRWVQRVQSFVRADGTIGTNDDGSIRRVMQAKDQEIRSRRSHPDQRTGAQGWRLIGPRQVIDVNGEAANNVSNTYCVHFNKSNPLIGYCATETGYIFKTTDGGNNWTAVGMALVPDAAIRSIASLPSNPAVVYAGDNSTIYKSTDGGLTWASIFKHSGGATFSLLINPLREATILIGTQNNGVYQSYNGGQTFTQRLQGKVTGIEYRPGDTTNVFVFAVQPAATAAFPTDNFNAFFFKSTNGGKTFAKKNKGWFSYGANTQYVYCTGDLTVTDANNNYIYALLASERYNNGVRERGLLGVMLSRDAGETWELMHGYPSKPNLMTFAWNVNTYDEEAYWQGDYNNWIIANKNDPSQVIVGALTAYKSTNFGRTWEPILGYGGSFGLHPDYQNFAYNGNDLWLCNDGGLLKSSDFCATKPIAKSKGVWARSFWGFGWSNNHEIYTGGGYHVGNISYFAGNNNNGTFWNLGGAEAATGYVAAHDSVVYHSDMNAWRLSSDPGKTPQKAENISLFPNESYGARDEISQMIYHPNFKNIFYLGKNNGLWKTTDGGKSFAAVFTFDQPIYNFQISHSAPDTIYAVTRFDNKLYVSFNGGASFKNITGTLPGGMKVLAVNGANPLECWVLFYGTGNVYKTSNGGTTWSANLGAGLPAGIFGQDINVSGDVADPTVSIAARHNGVFYKNNSSSGWQQLNLHLPAKQDVRRLITNYKGTKYVLALDGGGVWEHDLPFAAKPVVQFSVTKKYVECNVDTVQYFDNSLASGNVVRQWSFPGAAWTSSLAEANPRVVYTAPGTYAATLQISGANGSNTKTVGSVVEMTGNKCAPDSLPGKALSTYPVVLRDVKIGNADIKGNNFTIMLWVKPEGLQKVFSMLAANDATDSNRFGLGISFSNYFDNLNLVYTHSTVNYWQQTSIFLDTAQWNHIALTYSPSGVKIYKNGQAPWTFTSSAMGSFPPVDFTTSDFFINNDVHHQGGDFKGELEELAFYNYALTQEEIREKMHLTHKASEAGLVKYIPFNQYGALNGQLYDHKGTALSIVPPSNIIRSTAPVGPGEVDRMSIAAAGTYTFPRTGVTMTFPASSTYPGGEVVITRIRTVPDAMPQGLSANPKIYYAINNYGNNVSFGALTAFQLGNLPGAFHSASYSPASFNLYHRKSTDWGSNTWVSKGAAVSFSGGASSSIGFGVQNNINSFSQFVVATEANLTPLAVAGLTLKLSLINKTAVRLLWQPKLTVEGPVVYTIERSGDGVHFSAMATGVLSTVINSKEQSYEDRSVSSGTYFYRIRIQPANGQPLFSAVQTILVPVLPLLVTAFPNPVEQELFLKVVSERDRKVSASIYDSKGALVWLTNVTLLKGTTNLMVPASRFVSGSYIVRFATQDQVLADVKFIKH